MMNRISKVATEYNISVNEVIEHLKKNGYQIHSPNTRITLEQERILEKKYKKNKRQKQEAGKVAIHESIQPNSSSLSDHIHKEKKKPKSTENLSEKKRIAIEEKETKQEVIRAKGKKLSGIKVVGKAELPNKEKVLKKKISDIPKKKEKNLESKTTQVSKEPKKEESQLKENILPEKKSVKLEEKPETMKTEYKKLRGLKVEGKMKLADKKDKTELAKSSQAKEKTTKKYKRKRIQKSTVKPQKQVGETNKYKTQRNRLRKTEISKKETEKEVKKNIARMNTGVSTKLTSKRRYRKEKRSSNLIAREQEMQALQEESIKKLKVMEFISTAELATLMNVDVNKIISNAMSLGIFISINQRLEADIITFIAEDFGYSVEFTSLEEDTKLQEEDENEEELVPRSPVVTIMGHVDHGKTSLLDYIRNTHVMQKEVGGITQHIGAYDVITKTDRRIVFLDTPGHEAFTAMRARGAKLTDIAVIVIAADSNVMPQTIEALNHASAASVTIVIAINKIDKPTANSDKIKEELSRLNYAVEGWGGSYQCYEISAKTGQGIQELLEGVTLEADILKLKANPNKRAVGTVIEASLDKGRGYIATVLIQSGTLALGDIILASYHHGRVKAITDHNGKNLKKAGPSTPVQVLGLGGAPQAGDKFNGIDSEKEAREIAGKRQQIIREQKIRATRRTTLSDIGKRIAIGSFQELNIILKGDVDGSVEALSDSLLKLSTKEFQTNIIHKAVGPISESDILLAAASEAIVIGFQVRPTVEAKKLASKEKVEIRLYSIIFNAINDIRDAMEGMLAPEIQEVTIGSIEIREIFNISKVGTIAGCYVKDGYVKYDSKIRLIRDGIVIYGGEGGTEIKTLKRFKEDVNEVKSNFECGLSIKNFNDIKVGDMIEVFKEIEVKRKLK